MIYTSVNISEKEHITSRLGVLRSKAPKVIANALNRSAEEVRTLVVKKTREDYYVKASDVRNTITITRATEDRTRVIVLSRATKRELAAFIVRPSLPNPQKPPSVLRVAVKKDGLKDLPGAFLVRGISTGNLHVTTRVAVKRYPIRTQYGPAVPQMIGQEMNQRQFKNHVENQVKQTFNKRLEHEINRVLGG